MFILVSKVEVDNEQTFVFTYKGRSLYVKDVLTTHGMPSLSERLKTPQISQFWI